MWRRFAGTCSGRKVESMADQPTQPDPPDDDQARPVEPVSSESPAEPESSESPAEPVRRVTPANVVVALLLALLGFTLVVQVKSVSTDPTLAAARQEDLVRILSDLDAREERL